MNITNVAWVRDHQHRQVLRLDLNGHPAHIISKQQLVLTRRGLVKGIDFLASDWRGQAGHPFIAGQVEPGLAASELAGCTDDPVVFALYGEMCGAIRDGSWRPGLRPLS